MPADFAETVMAISGKPAIILPYTAVPPVMGETVVIAWKATLSTARFSAKVSPRISQACSAGPPGATGTTSTPKDFASAGGIPCSGAPQVSPPYSALWAQAPCNVNGEVDWHEK